MIAGIQKDNLFQHYFNNNYSYDELLGEDGNLRPHWKTFFESFGQLGSEELVHRRQELLHLLKENGVTYNIYGDPAGFHRPWNLDPIPFLISKNEWQTIESGLIQRAELFDLILKDIYGEQRLIKSGLLPLELIYNHTGFLRQCAGIKLPGKHNLIIHATDMARSPDGKVWILNDRTQAPSGAGYTVENRTAMARVLPELFNGLKVRRLTSYFNGLKNALSEISPGQKQNPRIVILTPGPSNETYFEHSYLSSYLGFTLVQGDDLMVKDSFVWLKTLGGLEKVDIIIRRVDDVYCDPLELKEDSQLGVPGLLQAVRAGNVSIANPLGCSILENPGMVPFLQNISKYFFNKELIMPTIASWWCGQPREMNYVLDHIKELVVKRIYRESTGSTTVDVSSLTSQQISELKIQIKAQPYLYVAQEKINFSSTPSLVNGNIEPRNAVFRSFAVSQNDSYIIMSGGLTRSSAKLGEFVISNQAGGISKDTWIISPEPGRTLNLRKELAMARTELTLGVLPSRTAENLFWVGRYAERVLGNARFLRTAMQTVAEGNKLLNDNDIQTEHILLKAVTHYTFTYPGFVGDGSKKRLSDSWNELKSIVFDKNKAGGLANNFILFNKAVYAVRDHWSSDTWRVLKGMEEEWFKLDSFQNPNHHRILNALDNLITSMVAFMGLNMESMAREQGWLLLDSGRKLEQSLLLVNMLRSTMVNHYDEQVEYSLQEYVLSSNESLVNYRYRYRTHLQLSLVLDLMLLDPNNPKSLMYQLETLKKNLAELPRNKNTHELSEQERLILEAYTLLKLSDKYKLSEISSKNNNRKELLDLLSKLFSLLSGISEVISKTYFKHAQAQKQLFSADTI